jgi:hypothetical protein
MTNITTRKKKGKKAKKSKKNNDDDADKHGKDDQKLPAKPKCNICGKIGHRDENCWTSEKNAKKYAKMPASKALFTEEQVSLMMGKVMALMKEKYGGKKNAKREVHFSDTDYGSDSDSDSSDKNTKKEDSPYSLAYTYLFDYNRIMEAPMHQRQNFARYSAEIIVEIVDSQNNIVPRRALLDTGTSEMILLKPFISPTSVRGYDGSPITWKTLGGDFVTHRKAEIKFAFPELSDKKYVTWVTHVDHSTKPTNSLYDMIIGMDCMCSLGI